MSMSTCDTCKAPIVVALTRRGDWWELDPEPSESGNARLVRNDPWTPTVEFLHSSEPGERYAVHACPTIAARAEESPT
jgi:hypothetical protein